jgi:hypothetical protein
VADSDSDGDGVVDCLEGCANGFGDDADGDGVCGDADACPREDATGLDADRDGCVDNLMGLNALIGRLGPQAMASEIKGSFTAKVRAVARTAGNDTLCAAVRILEAFQNAVAAHRGRKIDEATAALLTAYVDNVIAQLLAQLPEGESCGG